MLAIVVLAMPLDAYAQNGTWLVSDGGSGPWQKINGSCVQPSRLRGGDFNGDGKTDVFTTWGGMWRVSWGGTTTWNHLNTSVVDLNDLRFGDFDSDGKTDVYAPSAGKWKVSLSGSGPWKMINQTSAPGISDPGVSGLLHGNYIGSSGNKDTFKADTTGCP
jgi:hypothetical protein